MNETGDIERTTYVPPSERSRRVPLVISAAVAAILLLGGALLWHASAAVNDVAMASSPKPVTVVRAKKAQFRESRLYVGTLKPWVEANVGPQFVSAYVDTVLVRPGAPVKRGQVLATLDCRNASAASRAIEAEARSLEARQRMIAKEASRTEGLLSGGFVSKNEIDKKVAESDSEVAQIEAQKATSQQRSLEVNDCVLRAPFDGEVARRMIDPGAFVKPGTPIVTVVDRSIVRMVTDAPEMDFDAVAPGTPVEVTIVATRRTVVAKVARRAPSADDESRTVSFEVDVADPKREIPAWTTGEVHLEVGQPQAATELPVVAATVRGGQATLFVVDGQAAHTRTVAVLGEAAGKLYLDPTALNAETRVITEGRAIVSDGDAVDPHEAVPAGARAELAK